MKEENLYTPHCIRTVTGLYVNVFEPTPEMICIEDIAHALSMQARFGGHLPRFYSVAQHSVLVSHKAKDALQGLMHDAAEAYILDMPSPIKKMLIGYAEVEENLMRVIAAKFGFDPVMSEETKAADKLMLEYEWEHLMLQKQASSFYSWTPAHANTEFLRTFYLLTR